MTVRGMPRIAITLPAKSINTVTHSLIIAHQNTTHEIPSSRTNCVCGDLDVTRTARKWALRWWSGIRLYFNWTWDMRSTFKVGYSKFNERKWDVRTTKIQQNPHNSRAQPADNTKKIGRTHFVAECDQELNGRGVTKSGSAKAQVQRKKGQTLPVGWQSIA